VASAATLVLKKSRSASCAAYNADPPSSRATSAFIDWWFSFIACSRYLNKTLRLSTRFSWRCLEKSRSPSGSCQAAIDAAAFSLGHCFSSCASISFIKVDVLVGSCRSFSAMRSDAAHSCFWTAGGSLAPCGGSQEAALSRRNFLRRAWLLK
jgi:hypothetical protein